LRGSTGAYGLLIGTYLLLRASSRFFSEARRPHL